MKRFALRMILTLLSVVGALNLHAYDFEVDGIYYNILSTTDLTVAVAPKYDKYNETSMYNSQAYSGVVQIPEKVEYNGNTYTVTAIADEACINCSDLTDIALPGTIITIGKDAFYNCSNLKKLYIPKSVTSIHTYSNNYYNVKSCFYGCSNLDEISVEEGNKVYDSRDNCNALIKTATNELILCTASSIVIPKTVKTIGSGAFLSNNRLNKLNIPASVLSISSNAFYGCSSLIDLTFENSSEEIYISNNLEQKYTAESMFTNCPLQKLYIGRPIKHSLSAGHVDYVGKSGYLFSPQPNLQYIEIGENVTDLGPTSSDFFPSCTGIRRIRLRTLSPPELQRYSILSVTVSKSFSQTAYETTYLYIPKGTLEKYKEHDVWGQFINILETSDYSGVDDVTEDAPKVVDVYNMQGVRVRKGVQRIEATQGLPQGIYIIGGEKVLVK